MTTGFYASLPVLEPFDAAVNTTLHADLPDDWWVIVTDVVGSTAAIEAGKYKNVNSVGVATIVAITNVDRSIELPFVFGGDGCVSAVPAALEPGVRASLVACKRIAKDGFGLDLRVGLVPARVLRAQGHWLRLAKTRTSAAMLQAALSGRGWEAAEKLVKDPATRATYEVVDDGSPDVEADLSGYECRWQGVEPTQECTLAVVVQAMAGDDEERVATYREVLAIFERVTGAAVGVSRAVSAGKMTLSLDPRKAWQEAHVLAGGKTLGAFLGRFLKSYGATILGRIFMGFGMKTGDVSWDRYKDEVVANSDCQKFDGALKLVLDASRDQGQRLRAALETLRAQGRVVYGVHESRSALITCIVRSYNAAHIHFIDGSDGGYAMAAKQVKKQMAERAAAAPGVRAAS